MSNDPVIPIAKCTTVLQLLRPRIRWTKGDFAKTGNNLSVKIDDPRAAKFCLFGAIEKIYRTKRGVNTALNKLRRSMRHGSFAAFNDSSRTKHEDVLRLVKAAGI